MKRLLLVTALVVVAFGTVIATGAFPVDGGSDELEPAKETGIFLSPADTPNGHRYAEIREEGNLNVTLEVVAGTRTTFDDVFVLRFEGVEGSDDPTEVWVEHDSSVLTILRMDTRQPVDGPSDAITLEPGEYVMLGFVAEADPSGPTHYVETVTYRATVPDSETTTTPETVPIPTTTTTTPVTEPTTTEPQQGGGPTPSGTTTADPAPETTTTDPAPETTTTDPATGTATADPGRPPTTDPASGGDSPEFPGGAPPLFTIASSDGPWYVWVLLTAVLTVLVDYLTQTRARDVVPLLETSAETRRPRTRYALLRLGLLWVSVLVLALVATEALWRMGFRGLPLFLTVLLGSVSLGAMLGLREYPDIEGEYLQPVADGSGENDGSED